MTNVTKFFEKVIVISLMILMMITILLSTVELGIILFTEILNPPIYVLDFENLLKVFGFFLMVLIGLELLETISAYIEDNIFHLEIVIIVAMIAIARKIIILDYKTIEPPILFGMAALIIALSAGYFLIKTSMKKNPSLLEKSKDHKEENV